MNIKHFIRRKLAPVIYGNGTVLVPKKLINTWAEWKFYKELLKRLNVDCVLDVGANVGQYGHELRMLGFDGLILSFEPDSAAYAALERRARSDPKWQVFNIALGSTQGNAKLNIMEASVFNSFRTPNPQPTQSIVMADNHVVKQVEVKIDTLNRIVPELKAEFGFNFPFLKMDTQGFDLEVFRGGNSVWSEFVGIQSEVAVKQIYSEMPSWIEAIAEYEAANFDLAGLYSVHPDSEILIEFDCFLTRRDSHAMLKTASNTASHKR